MFKKIKLKGNLAMAVHKKLQRIVVLKLEIYSHKDLQGEDIFGFNLHVMIKH